MILFKINDSDILLEDSSIIIQFETIIMIGGPDDSTIQCNAWLQLPKNQLKIQLFWTAFIFAFISVTIGKFGALSLVRIQPAPVIFAFRFEFLETLHRISLSSVNLEPGVH